MNKKGNVVSIILVIGFLFLVIIIGAVLAFGGMTINWIFDEAVPELSNLGVVGDANLTQAAEYTIVPANSIVQSFTWVGGLLYAIALVGAIGLSFAFRFTGNKWMAGLFIMLMLVLVLASIFISNIYEEFYNDGSEVGTMLHEFTLLSWFILYSPLIMSIVGFICGIIMFTGDGEENVIV